jgi:hypothetical protein
MMAAQPSDLAHVEEWCDKASGVGKAKGGIYIGLANSSVACLCLQVPVLL